MVDLGADCVDLLLIVFGLLVFREWLLRFGLGRRLHILLYLDLVAYLVDDFIHCLLLRLYVLPALNLEHTLNLLSKCTPVNLARHDLHLLLDILQLLLVISAYNLLSFHGRLHLLLLFKQHKRRQLLMKCLKLIVLLSLFLDPLLVPPAHHFCKSNVIVHKFGKNLLQ